ncbi:MAG: bifunctional alpha,alpha-trehalose-phosphate synthase (UDP-forming)/trehalose-phosphatase [Candidatus Mycalebacterium zealandia]|nr:MAG: bifunctional alpha,alpha-trehalose-phosphate synthase (UDP-forming)/trehalose-phosphatase [Candidatus Mycalebacterium zealandia]
MDTKIITVSNRLPVSVNPAEKGGFSLKRNVGGVATGLGGAGFGKQGVWVGWPGNSSFLNAKGKRGLERSLAEKNLSPVFLSDGETDGYYNGFCNSTIWPLFHYFPQFAEYGGHDYETYRKVNEKFARAVVSVARARDTIWVHDYHLMLLPLLIRKHLPDAEIGFFLHTPFPASDVFRLIPGCSEILDGLLGADLIGFHTFDYVRNFAETVRRVKRIDNSLGVFPVGNRLVKADMFPMGVDVRKFSTACRSAAVKNKVKRKKNLFPGNCRIILSIDRLDYTKGIEKRLEAYDLFLKKNPSWRGRAVLLLVAVPSRTEVELYEQLRSKIERMVSEINGKWGTLKWEPVKYLYRSFNFQGMVSLYSLADVLFITPARDGMNLIAKEYVSSRPDGRGALILSEMAGTSRELGEAFIVNPNDLSTVSDALLSALEMLAAERKRNMDAMRARLTRYDLARWRTDFLDRLGAQKRRQSAMSSKLLSKRVSGEIVKKFSASRKRIIFTDYDGTLVPFTENPEDAKPDAEIKTHLRAIASNPRSKLVVVSGRDRKTLSKWLGNCADAIVAEHGAWIKDSGKWEREAPVETEWKKEISLIFEIFTDRTPGSFVEEKDYSVAWHYRKVDPSLAAVRTGELNEALANTVQNLGVKVMQGNKVIEVKDFAINKGASIRRWFADKWDCVIAMGDDLTDEDMFSGLPEDAYSIKIGSGMTKAKFYSPSVGHAREFIEKLAKIK